MTRPKIRFLIGGVQKAGTSALASYLSHHPGVALPVGKEAHVFDSPDFDDGWGVADVDARFAPHFATTTAHAGMLHGDATPIYLLHPRFIRRIQRYNPEMRWIILLRHPVDRALSQYHMERSRGDERAPLWWALLAEKWRLHGHADDFGWDSPLRHHGYRLRSDYGPQLASLHAAFPKHQVLTLRSEDLTRAPVEVMRRVHAFLGLGDIAAGTEDFDQVFVGQYQRWPVGSWKRRALCWWWRRELRAPSPNGFNWDGA